MRKLLGFFIAVFIPLAGVCAAKTYSDTEQKYYFGPEALVAALEQFVEKGDTRISCAELYMSLMSQETGQVSVADLFAVCRKAGFNTYRIEGFNKCREFVRALLDTEDKDNINDMMTGYCPGVDENGKNPNKLASITDKTRVGDVCTSSHIAMGEVVFQRDNSYSCTCLALVCKGDYDLRGGACNTPIPVGTPTCPNTKHKETSENNTTAKCLEFCTAKANREGCALSGVVMRPSTNECICSANADEIDAARQSMQQEEARINSLPYYAVCFDDKGKTGSPDERCVEGVFNWVNVGQLQAVGIAEEYARVKYGDTIKCKSGYDTHWNDDYIQCTSTQPGKNIYYEFQFDDVVESIDNDILADTVHSICKIHDLGDNVPHNLVRMLDGVGGIVFRAAVNVNTYGCKTTSDICSSKVSVSAAKFGFSTTYNSKLGLCLVQERRLARETADENLARISGVDPYVFFHGPQIQGGQTIVDKLRTVVSNAGHKVNSFRCEYSTGKIKKASGVIGFATGNTDDVLRCYLNGNTPVDFVFEDFSESWLYVRESGEAAIQCIVSGGKFANQKCHGLDEQQCVEAGKRLQAEFPGTSGTRWDGKDCVLVDAAEAKRYDVGVNIGLGIVGAVDCVAGTKVGCVLLAVEMGGLATEVAASELIASRVDEFLSVGTRCKARDCALSAIRDLGGKVMTVQGTLGDAEMHAVDQTLAELIEYLEPEDLGTLTGTEDWPQIIEQLGGNTNDLAGNVMVFAQYAGLIAQFASIGASGLRMTGRAVAKVAGKESRLGRAGTRMANFLETSRKTADAAGDVARGARGANTADNVNDAVRSARQMTYEEELETVGVRYVGNGRYQDMRNGSRFISHEDVLKRIDELPYETQRVAVRAAVNEAETAAASAGRSANAAGDGAQTAATTGRAAENTAAATGRAPLDQRLKAIGYDQMLESIRKGGPVGDMDASVLSPEEWAALSRSLESEGLELVQTSDRYGTYYRLGRKAPGGAAGTAARTVNGTTNAAAAGDANIYIPAGRFSDNAAAAQAANIATLRRQASANFDTYLAQAKVRGEGAKLPKERLTAAGWNELNRSLAAENVQLVDTGNGYMQFVSAGRADGIGGVFDARQMRVSDGSGKLYVRNSAREMLGANVSSNMVGSQIDELYGTIRRGVEYPVDDAKVSRAISAMENPRNSAVVYSAPRPRFDWHVHSYNGARSASDATYHVSLNVEVDDALIRKLDDIIARDQGRHIIDFKIPPRGNRWKTMADPISIYMRGTDPEIERAIAEAARPHVRTTSEVGLLGRKIDNGVAIAYETSGARGDIVENIINQVARKDANVAAELRAQGRYSVGLTEALRLWASDFLGYEIPPVIP